MGDFQPSIIQTDQVEVAHHSYGKGYKGASHTHLIATEINYILRGSCVVDDKYTLVTGDIWVYEPGDVSKVLFLEDTDLIIIKTPSVPGDKYLVEEE